MMNENVIDLRTQFQYNSKSIYLFIHNDCYSHDEGTSQDLELE